ncbi:MAG TPA: hypothetical protein VGS19_31595 [Streptosporangiaceae bacterium]|nr:hypothetical protein [Streptosporangiaceae bacterium]
MTRSRIRISFAALSVLGLAALGISGAAAATTHGGAAASTKSTINMYVTFYGWFDNSPPGCATAYSGCAGGAGTFSNPITFATDKAELPVGTKIYVPQVEKYFVMGDDCTECDQDWTGQGPDGGPHYRHVDLWIGGKNGTEFDVINCEDALTQGTPTGGPLQTPVVVNPGSGLTVSSQPLFFGGPNSDVCYHNATSPTTYGQYQNAFSHDCLDIAGTGSGAAANEAPCTGAANQDLGFDGAFFLSGNLCLKALGGLGFGLNWSGCGGGPPEQWNINGNGTISGTQSAQCIAETGNTVQIERCTTGNQQEEWTFTAEAPPAK